MRALLLAVPLIAVPAAAEVRPYTMHPSPDSRMELRVAKTGLLRGKQHLFVFESYRGMLRYDPRKPEASQVSLTIDAGSAKCKDTWVSAKDLRKIQDFALKDMMDAERHPAIKFVSAAIRQTAPGHFEVQGTLTIRGVARPASAQVSLTSRAEGSLLFVGSAQVRLTDYGLKPPSAALGAIGTKDEMSFSFALAGSPEGSSAGPGNLSAPE